MFHPSWYFILKNVTVHAAASVNIKDETWNSVFDRPHDALEDDIDINIWSDVEETALSHHICMHQDNINSDGRDAVESKENGVVESEQCFQDKDDYSAFVKDDDSAFVRDDDSAFVRNDDDSALWRIMILHLWRMMILPLLEMIVNYPNLHHLSLNLQQ